MARITCFEQLRHVSGKSGGAKCAMILPGTEVGVSNKEIYWDDASGKFRVINCLDGGSEQLLGWEELFDENLSCIGTAIRNGAFMTAEEGVPERELVEVESGIGKFFVDPYTRYVITPYEHIIEEYRSLLPDFNDSMIPELKDFVPDQIHAKCLSKGRSYELNSFDYIGMTGRVVREGEFEEWLEDERQYSGLLM